MANGAKDIGEKLKTGLGNAAGFVAKAGVAAVAAASAAVVAVGKQAVDSYAQYEQLVGGVETLFKGSAGLVEQYASQAYETAGLSANEYMETVTSFSASLLQSLGGDTEAAASYADMAIRDMSDNANKMGTDMTAIQNAYQGFAKANYTMLDNLKLGYGGTKSEMERLILDAENLDSTFQATRDANGDLTMSYADIVDAIHIVQDEMGITGTTAKEASTTIEGSVKSAKAAWKNWLTGLANGEADMEELTDQLFAAIETAADNIIPVVEQVLESLGKTLESKLPELISKAVQFVISHLPQIIALGFELVKAVIAGLGQGFQILYEMIAPWVQENIIEPVKSFFSTMKETGRELITNFITSIEEGIASLFTAIGIWLQANLIDPAINKVRDMIQAGKDAVRHLVDGIVSKFRDLVDSGKTAVDKIKEGFLQVVGSAAELGQRVVDNIIDGIASAWSGLTSWFSSLWDSLFGNLSIGIGIGATGPNWDGFHAGGLDYVPSNNYGAVLHRGEAVLTASEADAWRRGIGGGDTDVTINVYAPQGMDLNQLAYEIERRFVSASKQRRLLNA